MAIRAAAAVLRSRAWQQQQQPNKKGGSATLNATAWAWTLLLMLSLVLTLAVGVTHATFEIDRDHHYHYESVVQSTGKVYGAGAADGGSVPFRISAEVVIRAYNDTDGHRHCILAFDTIWFRRQKEEGAFVLLPMEDDWDQWFSFRQTPSGEIVEVQYPADEPMHVVNIKKGIISSLSARIFEDLSHARRDDASQRSWSTTEVNHGGEHDSDYIARRVGDYFHVTKLSHDVHPDHGTHLHRRVIILDAETLVPQRISIQDHVAFNQNKTIDEILYSDEDDDNEQDAAHTEHVARRGLPVEPDSPIANQPIDHRLPSWKFGGRSSTNITFMRSTRSSATVVIDTRSAAEKQQADEEGYETPNVIYMPPLHTLSIDSIRAKTIVPVPEAHWLALTMRHLDCFHQHPDPGSAIRAHCFSNLYELVQTLSDDNMTLVATEVFDVVNDAVHRMTFIETLGAVGTPRAQLLLLQKVLLADDADIEEVHKTIMTLHDVKRPTDETIRVLEAMCFHAGTEAFAFDLNYYSTTRKMALLALGSVIKNVHAYNPQHAEELLALLHDELDTHEGEMARRGVGTHDDDGAISMQTQHKSTVVNALGNAGHSFSADTLVAYATSEDEAEHVRSAALQSLRHLQSPEIDAVLLHALNDSGTVVRSAAHHAFTSMRRSVTLPAETASGEAVHTGPHRERRLSLKQILDWSWRFELRAPGFLYKIGFGSDKMGAFVKAESRNNILIHLSILKSYLSFDVYNEGAAYVAAFGKTIYIFRLLLAYIAWWGYDFEMIRKFGLEDIFNIKALFDKIVNWVKDKIEMVKNFVSTAIDRFKSIAQSVVNAVINIPNAFMSMFEKIGAMLTGQTAEVSKTTNATRKDEAYLIQIMIDLTFEFVSDVIGMNLTFVIQSVKTDLKLLGVDSNRGVVMIIDAVRLFFECPIGAIIGVIQGANDIRLALFSTNTTAGWGLVPVAAKIIDETGILSGSIPPWLTTIPDQAYVLLDEVTNYIEVCVNMILNPLTIATSPYTCFFKDSANEIVAIMNKIEYNKQWLLNITAYYMQVYENVTNTFRTIKSYILKVKSIIEGFFGPKFSKAFPFDPWQDTDAPSCADGIFTEDKNLNGTTTKPAGSSPPDNDPNVGGGYATEGKNTYTDAEDPGIDIALAGVIDIVAPWQGTVKATGFNWIVIAADSSLNQYDIKVQHFSPKSGLKSTYVKSGDIIGKSSGKSCANNHVDPVVRVSMKRKVPSPLAPTFVDPTKYLKRRIDIGLMMKETLNQFLYVQLTKTMVDLYILPTKGSFSKKNTTTTGGGTTTKRRSAFTIRTDPGADDIAPYGSGIARRGDNTCADFQGTSDVCLKFEKKNIVTYSIPLYAYAFNQVFGPVTVIAEFGAFLELGIDVWIQLCLMNKTCHAILTPHAGVAIKAKVVLDIGIAIAGLEVKGTILDIGLPIHGIVKFAKMPLDICVQLDMYIIPIAFYFSAFLRINLFGARVTVFDSVVFQWASKPIRFDAFLSNCQPKPDTSPPQFTKPLQCKQLPDLAPDSPQVFCEWATEDPDTGVASQQWCGGSSPGACDLWAYEDVSGDNYVAQRTHDESLLYVTLRAANKNGVAGTQTSAVIPFDKSVPMIRVFDGNATSAYLTTLYTARAMQRFQDQATAQYDVLDYMRPLVEVQWAVGTSPVAKVPAIPLMSDVIPWTNVTWTPVLTGSKSVGELYAPPERFLFLMQHNTKYYFHVRARNELNYEEAVASNGFLVDLTPPDVGVVNNGGQLGFHLFATQLNSVVSVNWAGFIDNESGLHAAEFQLSSKCDCSVFENATCEFGDIVPLSFSESYEVSKFRMMNPPLPDGFYYWRVRYENWVGLWSPFACRPFVIDTTPPLWRGPCVSNEQCMVMTYDVETNSITARWQAYDPESDIKLYQFALGLDETDTSLMPWTEVYLNTSWVIPNPPSGVKLVGKARAYNWVDLPARTFSNTLLIDSTPPIPGNVNDGGTLFVDVAYQKSTTEITFNWDSFTDPESGISGYYLVLGSAPGREDIKSLDDLYPDTFLSTRTAFLEANQTYYVTVIAKHNGALGLTANASANGVLVDMSKPGEEQELYFNTPINVLDGSVTDGNLDREYQAAASALSARWPTILDPQSQIYTIEVAYVAEGDPSEPENLLWLSVDNATSSSALNHLALQHGAKYFFFIRVTNGALWTITRMSNGVVVDLTMPLLHYLNDASDVLDLDYQSGTDSLSAYWLCEDPESDILNQFYSVWMGLPSVQMIGTVGELNENRGWAWTTSDTLVGIAHKARVVVDAVPLTGLTVTPGNAYFFQVTIENRANLQTILATDGVKIDTTPPVMNYVFDGLEKPDTMLQYTNNTMFGHWSAIDPESGILFYHVAIVDLGITVDDNYNPLPGKSPLVVTDWSDLCNSGSSAASKTATLAWTEGSSCTNRNGVSMKLHRAFEQTAESYGIFKLDVAHQLEQKHSYYFLIYAANGALTESLPMVSDGGVLIVQAPSPGTIYDGPVGGELQFQRHDSVMTAWFEGFASPAYGFTAFEVAIGTSTNASYEFDVLEFNDDPILITSKSDVNGAGMLTIPIPMQQGVKYFVTIKGITQERLPDGTWLSVMAISNGIAADSLSPVFADLDEGNHIAPVDYYQIGNDTLLTSFTVYDGHSCVGYNGTSKTCAYSDLRPLEYSVGTAPGFGDIVARRPTPAEGSATKLVLRPGAEFVDDAAANNASLNSIAVPEHGAPFIFNVFAVDNLGQASALSSHGLTVDKTEPTLGTVSCGPSIQADTTRFACSWVDFLDPESGIMYFNFSMGVSPGDTSIVDGVLTSDSTYLALNLNLTQGSTYYGTVRAVNSVGLSSSSSAPGVFIDVTPPVAGRIIEIGDLRNIQRFRDTMDLSNLDSFDDGCQIVNDRITIRFAGFFDPDGTPIVQYTAAVGTTRGGVQTKSFTVLNVVQFGNVSEAVIDGMVLSPQTTYYVTLRAFNYVGNFATAMSNGIRVSFYPPQPQFAVLQDYEPGYNDEFGQPIDKEFTSSLDTLGVRFVMNEGCDPSYLTYSIRIVTYNEDRVVMPWKDIISRPGAVFGVQFEALNLTNTYKYKFQVIATNQLGFQAYGETDGIQVINGGPPTPGVVMDGSTGIDVDFQASLTTINACWKDFIDFDGSNITQYSVAVGTDPRFDATIENVMSWRAVGPVHCFKSPSLTLTPLTQTYYFSVRAQGKFSLYSTASSNGVKAGFGQAQLQLEITGTPEEFDSYQFALRQKVADDVRARFPALTNFDANNVIIINVHAKKLFDLSHASLLTAGQDVANLNGTASGNATDASSASRRHVGAPDPVVPLHELTRRDEDFVEDTDPITELATNSTIILIVFDYPSTEERLGITDAEFTDSMVQEFDDLAHQECVGPSGPVDCLSNTLGLTVSQVALDLNAPTVGNVYDGRTLFVDVDFQSDNSTISVSWQNFHHDEGVIRYDVAIGFDPMPVYQPVNSSRWLLKNNGTDFEVLNMTTVTECPKTVTVDRICLPLNHVTLRNLTLYSNTTYYVSVRAVSRIDTESIATSDGIQIDMTPPSAGSQRFMTGSPPLLPPTLSDTIIETPIISDKVRFQADPTQIVLDVSNFTDAESGMAAYYYSIVKYPRQQCLVYPMAADSQAVALTLPFDSVAAVSTYTWPLYLPSDNSASGAIPRVYFPVLSNDTADVLLNNIMSVNGTTFDGLFNRTTWDTQLAMTGLSMQPEYVYYVSLFGVNGAGLPTYTHSRALVADATRPVAGAIFDGASALSDIQYGSDKTKLVLTFAEAPTVATLACPALSYPLDGPHADFTLTDRFWYDVIQTDTGTLSDIVLPSYEDAVYQELNVVATEVRPTAAVFTSGELYLSLRNVNNVTHPRWVGAQYYKQDHLTSNGVYKVRMAGAVGQGVVTRISLVNGDPLSLPFHTNERCASNCFASPYVQGFGLIIFGAPTDVVNDKGVQSVVSGTIWATALNGMLTFQEFDFSFVNNTVNTADPATAASTVYSPYDMHEWQFVFRELQVSMYVDGEYVKQFTLPFKLSNASLVVDVFGQPTDTLQVARAVLTDIETPTPEIDVCDGMDSFRDFESPILYYEWSAGTSLGDVDVFDFTRIAHDNICLSCRNGPCDAEFCNSTCDADNVRVISATATGLLLAEYRRYCNIANGGCDVAAICTASNNSETYFVNCTCPVGYTGNGTYCNPEIQCEPGVPYATHVTCSHDAFCTNLVGSFTCTCKPGFYGNGTHCEDMDECSAVYQQYDKYKCHPAAVCTNGPGNFSCACRTGYTGDGRFECINVDECLLHLDSCSGNASCVDTIGSYECLCDDNYFGDGFTCTPAGDFCSNPLWLATPERGSHIRQRGNAAAYTPYDLTQMTHCGPGLTGSRGVWHAFNGTGYPMQLTTCVVGEDPWRFDSVIEVFTGDCAHMHCLTFADDDAFAPVTAGALTVAGTDDQLSFILAQGTDATLPTCGLLSTTAPFDTVKDQQYLALVRGFRSVLGRYTLELRNLGAFVDDCACENNGTCDSLTGHCSCTINYTGVRCASVAVRSWCDEGGADLCSEYASCVDGNTDGTAGPVTGSCVCNVGFEGDGVFCSNENECVTRNFPPDLECDAIARCEDTFGSYKCSCPGGYMGSGRGTGTCVIDPDAVEPYPVDDLDKIFPITYYIALRAVNAAGLSTTVYSNGITIDTTPATFQYIDMVSPFPSPGYELAPIHAQRYTEDMSFRWLFKDAQSAVVMYRMKAGTATSDTELTDWVDFPAAITSHRLTGLSLVTNTMYFISIEATNGAGLRITYPSNGLLVDNSGPDSAAGWVIDTYGAAIACELNGGASLTSTDDRTWSTDRFNMAIAFGDFVDNESGIKSYDWAIGVTPGGEEIMPFTEAGASASPTGSMFALVTRSLPQIETGCGVPGPDGLVNAICLNDRSTYWVIGHSIYFRNFQLATPRTYYNTLRVWNNVGMSIVRSTNGINVVDSSSCLTLGCQDESTVTCGAASVTPTPSSATPGPAATTTAAAAPSASATPVAPVSHWAKVNMTVDGSPFSGDYVLVTAQLTDLDINAFSSSSATSSSNSTTVDFRRVIDPATIPPFQTYLEFTAMARAFSTSTNVDVDVQPTNHYRVLLQWDADYFNITASVEQPDVVVYDRVKSRWIEASSTCASPHRIVTANTIEVHVCVTSQLAFVKTALAANTPAMSCQRSGCSGVVYVEAAGAPPVYCNCDSSCRTFGDCCLDHYDSCPQA